MIRLFILSLVAIFGALIVTLNGRFFEDPGYLLLVLGDNSFETSLLAFAFGLIVVFVIFDFEVFCGGVCFRVGGVIVLF